MDLLKPALTVFFEMPESLSEQVGAKFKPKSIKKGDFWFREGDAVRKLAFQTSGYIRVFAHTEKQDVTQWISLPGYFTTDIASFFNNQPARWSMQALTDVEILEISASDLESITNNYPEWVLMERKFLIKCFAMMENRIFSMLHHSAEERFNLMFSQFPDLFNQVPLQYLASMMGMSPETLSRLRAKR